ncbi:hypothetical protein [Alkalihalobacterium sp. APHAB7]|uniref:hypothetical protein n=1 Tax=Alkalihalobacterium sp. APHAB7 TaxID=3402081 RepID=UPI003AAF3748
MWMRKGRLTEKRKKELLRGLYIKPMLLFFLLFIVVAQATGGTNALFNDVEIIKDSIYVPIWEEDDDDDGSWDKSSLSFLESKSSYGFNENSNSIFATVKNGGDGDMRGTSEFELLYIFNSNNVSLKDFTEAFGKDNVIPLETGQNNKGKGNPHYQVVVYEGEIPQLDKNHEAKVLVMLVELEKQLEEKLELLLGNKDGKFKFKGYHRPGHGNNDEIRKVIRSEDIKVSNIKISNNVQTQNSSILEEDTKEVIKVEGNSEESELKKEDKVGNDTTDAKEIEEKIQKDEATTNKTAEGKEEKGAEKDEPIEDTEKKESKATISSTKNEEEAQSDKDSNKDES